MGLDFTIAVYPSSDLHQRDDILYAKMALIYGDKIELISPVASIFNTLFEIMESKNATFELLDELMPFISMVQTQESIQMERDYTKTKLEYQRILQGTPQKTRRLLNKQLSEGMRPMIQNSFPLALANSIGSENYSDFKKLTQLENVQLHSFKNIITDLDRYAEEYVSALKQTLEGKSYPLFDVKTNKLIQSLLNEGLLELSISSSQDITHAGFSKNLILELPNFEKATVDEVVDIRKELNDPLVRFRSALMKLTSNIKQLPWDADFERECDRQYSEIIAPALLEIKELSQEKSIWKNLFNNISEDIPKGITGIAISITAGGHLSNLVDNIDAGMIVGGVLSTGVYLAPKVAKAILDSRKGALDIKKKDMYFYFRAGEMLKAVKNT